MADFQQQLANARLKQQEEYFKKNPSKRPQPKKEIPAPVNASFTKKDEENRTELDKALERAQWKRRKEYVATNPTTEIAGTQTHPRAHRLGTTPTDEETRQQLVHEISLQHAEKVIVACKKPEPVKQRHAMVEEEDDEREPVDNAHLPTVNEPISLPTDFEPTCFCMTVKHTKSVMLRICKHCFHESCLLEWMKKAKTCPTCRCRMYFSPQDTVNEMQAMQT